MANATNSLTQDRSRHIAEVGPRGQHGRTPHRMCCRVPTRHQRAFHGGLSGYVGRQRPHSHRGPGSVETLDDPPDTCSHSTTTGRQLCHPQFRENDKYFTLQNTAGIT